MFDVNPTAHAYYLRDLDRVFAGRLQKTLRGSGKTSAKRPPIPVVVVCLFLTLTLASAISGGLAF
jgi:hypothetical protein